MTALIDTAVLLFATGVRSAMVAGPSLLVVAAVVLVSLRASRRWSV